MPLWLRIVAAVILGGVIALILLMTAGPAQKAPVLLWNVNLFIRMAGNGPLLGYDQHGNPMYEGTPVHVFFWLLGLASTFPIYMIVCFVILTIVNKFRSRQAGDV